MNDSTDDRDMLLLVTREMMQNRRSIPEREAANQLTELMIRLLHYQEHGEPTMLTVSHEAIVKEWETLSVELRNRYRNEYKFHQQVTRAVAAILSITSRIDPRL